MTLFAHPTRSGFWSGETLRTRLGQGTPPIIETYDWRNVEYASYLLTIGDEIYVTPTKADEANSRTKQILKDHESYVIPSGQLERDAFALNRLGMSKAGEF